MPIYMDRHIIPGITAKDAAEAHRLDILMQDESGCRCMTYWVDEERGSAFCLIDAPCKEAVVKLHNKAHGLIPHQIIEVNGQAVKSFLGRIEDPEVSDLVDNSKIFNEPVFRTVLMVKLDDPILLQAFLSKSAANTMLSEYRAYISEISQQYQGQQIEHEQEEILIAFISTAKAVKCALEVHECLNSLKKGPHQIASQISLNAGIPVQHSETLFGDTIHLAKRLLQVIPKGRIIAAPIINDLYKVADQNHRLKVITTKEESFLNTLMNTLDTHWAAPNFGVVEFSKAMNMSKSACYRQTIALTGLSPSNLIKEFRLKKALVLLKKRNRNVSETSFDCGFTSPSYFTKCFQKRFGITPNVLLNFL